MKVSAAVYMTLQVEVYVGSWDAAQPFEQLHQQAVREAAQKLSNVLQKGGGSGEVKLTREAAVMHVVTKECQ